MKADESHWRMHPIQRSQTPNPASRREECPPNS